MDSLKELAAEKEREWREVQELRIQSLEKKLIEKEKDLNDKRIQFQQLKNDFQYNLQLLSERDAELDKYDTEVSVIKSTLALRDSEVSDLKIQIDMLRQQIAVAAKEHEELIMHNQHRVREKQAELEEYKCKKDAEIQREREELVAQHRQLIRQLKELEDDKDVEKRQLTVAFEEALRKREQEMRKQADEMNVDVLAHEMKVKLLVKELDFAKASEQNHRQRCNEVENVLREFEKKLKQKEWELNDVTTMKDLLLKERDIKLKELEMACKKLHDELQRRQLDMEQQTTEHEAVVRRLRSAAKAEEERFQEQLNQMHIKVEEAETQIRQLNRNIEEICLEKNKKIEELDKELNTVRKEWERNISEMSRENVSRDVELRTLKEKEQKFKSEIMQRRDDIDRYRQELSLATERQLTLEREKAQVELDWQRKMEDVEREHISKTEELIKRITVAKDEAQAAVKEREREILHHTAVIDVLRDERARAIVVLQQHGIVIDRKYDISASSVEDFPKSAADHLIDLRKQNATLLQVIHEMRQQMESIGNKNNLQDVQDVLAAQVSADYVKTLENELKDAKKKLMELQQPQEHITMGEEVGMAPVTSALSTDNTVIKSHIEHLNALTAKLRTEKVELMTQVRKQQVQIKHLQDSMSSVTDEPKKRQLEYEQLQYQFSTTQRRHQAEVASLKDTINELRLRLEQAQQESDEFHKVMVDRSLEVNALNKEVSSLKVQLAQGTPAISFGAQELLIQQLQDEIMNLHKQHEKLFNERDCVDNSALNECDRKLHGTSDSSKLKRETNRKLKVALQQIHQLTRERQQLFELGNRMRAELNKHGIVLPSSNKPTVTMVKMVPSSAPVVPQSSSCKSVLQQKLELKLHQLKQLQTELTEQHQHSVERQLAQTDSSQILHTVSSHQPIDATTSPIDSEYDDWKPKSILKYKTSSTVEETQLSRNQDGVLRNQKNTGVTASISQGNNLMITSEKPSSSDVLQQTQYISQNQSVINSQQQNRVQSHPTNQQNQVNPNPVNHTKQSFVTSSVSSKLSSVPTGLHVSHHTVDNDLQLFSSDGGESLQDVWKLLDDSAITPRPLSSRVVPDVDDARIQMSVEGKQIPQNEMEASVSPSAAKQKRSKIMSRSDMTKRKPKTGPVVRNWNVKNDSIR